MPRLKPPLKTISKPTIFPPTEQLAAAARKAQSTKPWEADFKAKPRLWNAKRRVESSRGLNPKRLDEYKKDPERYTWRDHVSPDVAEFIDKANLLPDQRLKCLRSPSRFFAYPANVPTELRKQVYLCVSRTFSLRAFCLFCWSLIRLTARLRPTSADHGKMHPAPTSRSLWYEHPTCRPNTQPSGFPSGSTNLT